ncbi:MAG TPA: glycine cleavage system protein H [Anaeromyxobacteraceae bacterium]|nr:glycine cleavage system protein H [Anaeromyxobacteraceae bacterium]
MQTFNEILQVIGAFAVGIAGRTLLFVVGAALLTIPAVILAIGINAVRSRRERTLARVGNLVYKEGAYYAPNHTWLAPRSAGDFDVGIDDIARKIIPGSSSVDLPRAGARFHKGDPIAVVRAGGREVMISAPLDGEVTRVNSAVSRDPALVRDEAYGRGWLFSFAPADAGYLRFPSGYEAAGWLAREKARLNAFIETELGIAAADGGELSAPVPAALGEEGWRKVVSTFLHGA